MKYVRRVALAASALLFAATAHAQVSVEGDPVPAQSAVPGAAKSAPDGPVTLDDATAFGTYSYNEGMQASFETKAEFDAFAAEADAFSETLTPLAGRVELPGAGVSLDIGEGHYFLRGPDARRVLEEQWGNLPDDRILGMIMERDTDHIVNEYAVAITFDEIGYVSDADAADIDYDEVEELMADATRAQNAARVAAGLSTIEWRGWAEEPAYDPAAQRVEWAKLVRFGGVEEDTLNYNMRFLGRRGVLEFNFIASEEALPAIKTARPALADMVSFQPGHAYADYNPATDKAAAYGVAGLVAGGALAKKAGLLGVLALVLKKGWIFIVLGAGALWRGVRAISGRKTDAAGSETPVA